jgi:hypothetical protein
MLMAATLPKAASRWISKNKPYSAMPAEIKALPDRVRITPSPAQRACSV